MAFTPKLYILTFFFLLVLTLSLILTIHSRSLSSTSSESDDDDTCIEAYGFMPCSTSWVGNSFLILVYGYLVYRGTALSSTGTELSLEVVGPGPHGGSILSILGALPGALLVLVSGLSKSVEAAQARVSAGVGLLAGSTILLLTVVWGSCVVVGKCELQDRGALDKVDTKGYSLTGSGVSTDILTSHAARIMGISTIPFIIIQVPQILSSTSGRHLAVLIALVISIALLISHCLYQEFQPWIRRRKLAYVKHKHVIFEFSRLSRKRTLGELCTDDGEVNEEGVKKLFKKIDENNDGYLSAGELKALIVGVRFDGTDLDQNEAINKIMRDFNSSGDSRLDEREFVGGITRWLNRAVGVGTRAGRRNFSGTMKFPDDFHHETRWEHFRILHLILSFFTLITALPPKAVFLLVLGNVIVLAFADPLVSAVINFSKTASIPVFFTSFIAVPLAINFSDAVSTIILAGHKRRRYASLTFSELYATVTLNNFLRLSVFLALVYIRGLTWDFSAEVLVILVVCVLMSALASFRTTYPLWTSLVAFLLYPSSLALVYFLDFVLGWS